MKNKKCLTCKTEMTYNHHYECYECSNCGATYNAAMQELRPRSEWQEEYDSEDY